MHLLGMEERQGRSRGWSIVAVGNDSQGGQDREGGGTAHS